MSSPRILHLSFRPSRSCFQLCSSTTSSSLRHSITPLKTSCAARSFITSVRMASSNQPKLDSETISTITEKEKQLTGSENPQKGGPTAQAQAHAGEPLNSNTISSITRGEKNVIGDRVKGGPTATAQSILTRSNKENPNGNTNENSSASDGVLHGDTISNIRKAESKITGQNQPVRGGPTAQAQSHTGEPIDAQVLRDITKGETSISGRDQPLPGGPTAQAQHDLAKSRK